MAETPKLLAPSWDKIYDILIELAESIRAEYCPELLIGVARGGLIPARIIADLLDIPTIGSVGVAFYKDVERRMKNPIITQPLNVTIASKRVLIVDDIVDTGESLALVASEVKGKPEELRTATLYRKPSTRFTPDYSGRETDSWVIFPWEIKETTKKIGKRLLDSGKTLQEVGNYLVPTGIDKKLIWTFLRELCGEPQP